MCAARCFEESKSRSLAHNTHTHEYILLINARRDKHTHTLESGAHSKRALSSRTICTEMFRASVSCTYAEARARARSGVHTQVFRGNYLMLTHSKRAHISLGTVLCRPYTIYVYMPHLSVRGRARACGQNSPSSMIVRLARERARNTMTTMIILRAMIATL